jgi:hypothetical protein
MRQTRTPRFSRRVRTPSRQSYPAIHQSLQIRRTKTCNRIPPSNCLESVRTTSRIVPRRNVIERTTEHIRVDLLFRNEVINLEQSLKKSNTHSPLG